MEVTDNESKVIPGLYAAGEVLGNGQLMGHGVVGGMSVGPAITFGRMAARAAHRFAQCNCLG
jgi:fumarate reductase flavoprotein subunit